MNVMDYDMPELVVFIQEDHQQFVKDICIDKVVSPEGKCLSEDHESDHNIIPCDFDPNMKSKSDLNKGTKEGVSIKSTGSECATQHSSKDAMKMFDLKNMMKEGEVEFDSGDKISIDNPTKKTTSETLREAFRKEREFSRSFKNWQINSFLGTIGSRVEFPHCADCLQVTNTNMSRPEMSDSQSLTGSGKRQVDNPQETSSSAIGPQSGPISYTSPTTISSCASHKSNDSISSTHSFAFPILPVEWSGSPVRMLEADKSQSRKHPWWKISFPCCKC
ncbi:hypothetical protein SESBI_48572 [Sesbania bispinosa]|nr:hypothetical protein SESBI_48572 [Sesbania bispinosa]